MVNGILIVATYIMIMMKLSTMKKLAIRLNVKKFKKEKLRIQSIHLCHMFMNTNLIVIFYFITII